MEASKSVEEYISKHEQWRIKLEELRITLLRSGMEEGIKWGMPTYTLNGKNVLAIAAFKNHIGLWFHQGVFLKDEAKVLVSGQEDKTRGMRQWRFESEDEIDKELVFKYAMEAVENQKAGKEIKPEKKKLVIPVELKQALESNKELQKSFNSLTPGRQREYAEHIKSAKQESTRLARLAKSIPTILAGKGLHEKYR